MKGRLLLLGAVAALAAGCAAAPPKKDYSAFLAADPHSLLIVPVVNRSVEINASDYFLSTLPMVAAERGFYVFPVNLVKRVLEDDGLSDADLVHQADTAKLCNLFGADAVLYGSIVRWDARYIVVDTNVTVEFDYRIKDCRTGDEIWRDHQVMAYSSSQGQSSGSPLADLIAMTIAAAITKASPNYMPMAEQANRMALTTPGRGVLFGPYSPSYRKDLPEGTAPKPAPAAAGTGSNAATGSAPAATAGTDNGATAKSPPAAAAPGADNGAGTPGAR